MRVGLVRSGEGPNKHRLTLPAVRERSSCLPASDLERELVSCLWAETETLAAPGTRACPSWAGNDSISSVGGSQPFGLRLPLTCQNSWAFALPPHPVEHQMCQPPYLREPIPSSKSHPNLFVNLFRYCYCTLSESGFQ